MFKRKESEREIMNGMEERKWSKLQIAAKLYAKYKI